MDYTNLISHLNNTIESCISKQREVLEKMVLIYDLKKCEEENCIDSILDVFSELIFDYSETLETEQRLHYLVNIYKIENTEIDELILIIHDYNYRAESFFAQNRYLFNASYTDTNITSLDEETKPNNFCDEDESIDDIELKLYESLNSNLKDKEACNRVMSKIKETEHTIIENVRKTFYETAKYHFENDGYYFSLYLKHKKYISNIERKNFRLRRYKYEQDVHIDSQYTNLLYYKLTAFLCENYNYKYDKASNLTISILSKVRYTLININKIDERICLLKDYESTKQLQSLHPSSISFKHKRKKIELHSKEIINHLEFILSNVLISNNINVESKISNRIEELEFEKKKNIHILIRKIANILIRNKIMTYTSLNGNKYNLKDDKGLDIGLRRKDADLIYDILYNLNVEIKKTKGPEQATDILYYDKMELIKERLETARSVDDHYESDRIANILLDFT